MIDAKAPDVVISSHPKLPSSKHMSGTGSWCWTSNSTEPYFHINFQDYAVICALNVSFNGTSELTYANDVLNKSKVYLGIIYTFSGFSVHLAIVFCKRI